MAKTNWESKNAARREHYNPSNKDHGHDDRRQLREARALRRLLGGAFGRLEDFGSMKFEDLAFGTSGFKGK